MRPILKPGSVCMPGSLWNSVPIETGQDQDGRYWADVPAIPGVMVYGVTVEAAIQSAQALALRVVADLIDAGEPVPEPFGRLFAIA